MSSDGVAGAGANIADRQAHSHTAAPKAKTPPAPSGSGVIASSTPETQGSSSELGRPSCGIAGMGSAEPVGHLPDLPPAEPAIFSGTNAQSQHSVCYVQPAKASLSAASPANLIANCHDVDDVVKVLKGLTSRDQQAYAADVVKLALQRFEYAGHINKLAEAVRDNPALRLIVVEQILHRAAVLESKSTPENRDEPRGPHNQAGAHVLAALKGMPGEELGALIAQKLSPKEVELLAKILDVRNSPGVNGILSQARHQILSALNSVPRTDTTGAVVQTLYLLILPEDTLTYCPPLAGSLAEALGREFYPQPQSVTAAATEKRRLQAF